MEPNGKVLETSPQANLPGMSYFRIFEITATNEQGCMVKLFEQFIMAPAQAWFLSKTPRFITKQLLSGKIEAYIKGMAKVLQSSSQLRTKIQTGPRAATYEAIRRHALGPTSTSTASPPSFGSVSAPLTASTVQAAAPNLASAAVPAATLPPMPTPAPEPMPMPAHTPVPISAVSAEEERRRTFFAEDVAVGARYIAGLRELRALEAVGGDVACVGDAAALDRLRCMGTICEFELGRLQLDPSTMPVTSYSSFNKLVWGIELMSDQMKLRFNSHFPEDITTVVAAFTEPDSIGEFDEEYELIEEVKSEGSTQYICHTIAKQAKTNAIIDRTVTTTIVDALGEPHKSVLIVSRQMEPNGKVLETSPQANLPGMSYLRIFEITATSEQGCMVKLFEQYIMAPAQAWFLSKTPRFITKQLLSGKIEAYIKGMAKVVQSSAQLRTKIQTGPRAATYEAIRCHALELK
eukprot:NODE_8802_length_1468_cov_17.167785.p1 GENE.NODE_8802_length_1468_cov_17.167785~~NODE_8802_length_1468_cov_17.167785.p1  ORF type:complete len:463 (-),score=84.34 NODE_8802_length_1468_cov_17.167785:80-1468(-)